MQAVEELLEQVDALPTLSPVALRLLALGSADEVDIDEVVALLESDPALTAMILGLCRRADRGLGDRIDTVKRAVVISDPNLGETIAIRQMVYLALTYDHRLVDGADAARFLTDVKQRLEAGQFEV